MSQRPRRSGHRLNYKQLDSIGFDEHEVLENWNNLSDEEDLFEEEVSEDDHEEAESESDDEGEVGEASASAILHGSDGTEWTTRIPRAPLPGWRNGLRNYSDGPDGEAKPVDGVKKSRSEVFGLMFTTETLDEVCHWTNIYGKWRADTWNSEHEDEVTRKVWQDLTVTELRAFIGLLLLGGVQKARHIPWSDLWTKDPRLKSHPFSATISQRRFYTLMSTLRFDDVLERRNRRHQQRANPDFNPADRDKLEPIRHVATSVISTFSRLYVPGTFVTIDEQLIRFRGHCPFRVYMKSKPGRYGIKVWALADTASRYVMNLQIYTGKEGSSPEVNQGKRVVLDLVGCIEGTQRGVVADNFFTSIGLVSELLAKDLSYCGTLRKCRREVPPSLRNVRGVEANTTHFLFNEDTFSTLVRHVPAKNKYFLILSSSHYDNTMVTVEGKEISEINHHYNSLKFGVDTVDQMVSFYSAQFPSRRWPMKVFIHLIEIVALNAYEIDSQNFLTLQKKRPASAPKLPPEPRKDFITQLAFELIQPQIQNRAQTSSSLHSHIQDSIRIMNVELPTTSSRRLADNDDNDRAAEGRPKQKRCKMCKTKSNRLASNQRQSQRVCEMCHDHVCVEHSERYYKCKDCISNSNSD